MTKYDVCILCAGVFPAEELIDSLCHQCHEEEQGCLWEAQLTQEELDYWYMEALEEDSDESLSHVSGCLVLRK